MSLPAKSHISPSKSEQTIPTAANRSVLEPLEDRMGPSTPYLLPLAARSGHKLFTFNKLLSFLNPGVIRRFRNNLRVFLGTSYLII